MSTRAIWLLRTAGLVVFVAIMWAIGKVLHAGVSALPVPVMTLLLGLLVGFCAGMLFGFRDAEKHYGIDRQRGN